MRAERFCIRKMRALPSAPEHPCFSLTEDLHGCLVLRKQGPPPRGKMRAERFCIRKMRALPSAPEHPCFSLTEDLHGCRSVHHAIRTTLRNLVRACCVLTSNT